MFNLQKANEKHPLSENKKQPSCLPAVKNPFKAPSKVDKSSVWKKLQEGEAKTVEESVESESSKKSDSKEIHKMKAEKESGGQRNAHGAIGRETEAVSSAPSQSFRDKKLPPGMRIKKRSNEDKKLHSNSEVTAERAEAAEGSYNSSKCEIVNKQQSKKETKSQDTCSYDKDERAAPEQKSKQNTNGHNPHLVSRTISTSSTDTEKGNSPNSAPKKESQDSPGRSVQGEATSPNIVINNDQKKTVKSPFGDWSDDDDVQLVSVQPGLQQTYSVQAAPLQKTLTSYPGFQLMSKDKSHEEDPTALQNQLTAQLKQKKVLITCFNGFLLLSLIHGIFLSIGFLHVFNLVIVSSLLFLSGCLGHFVIS